MAPDYRVATFVGPGALGTAHSVFLREHLEEAPFLEQSQHTSDTLVLLEAPGASKGDTPLRVRFFANGHPILRCGSGALAAAWVLSEHCGQSARTPVHLRTTEETVRVFRDGEGFGYESMPLGQQPLQETGVWQRIVGARVRSGALCGSESDYAIVELESEEMVRAAIPDLPGLTHASERALILTARENRHYVLRYFAPQYGQPEGSATGSANIQLLHYWYGQGCREAMTARQCSTSAGEFWGMPGADTVRLYGRVKAT
ncbi:PhzF family phenazine biosynthesis protein [Marinimicrobium agarilyticum]|uniref:PhzF family phenazine biosynthesis protein n=1 Tax=Marinimicrobium agarilyticum TaxID=306546 RepID=UPI00041D82DD|nr:PhzF family phenazine biosynthesis protein [Marinimicrobium agarilyticum]